MLKIALAYINCGFKVKHIHVYGLWGVKDIETSFDPTVNISRYSKLFYMNVYACNVLVPLSMAHLLCLFSVTMLA